MRKFLTLALLVSALSGGNLLAGDKCDCHDKGKENCSCKNCSCETCKDKKSDKKK